MRFFSSFNLDFELSPISFIVSNFLLQKTKKSVRKRRQLNLFLFLHVDSLPHETNSVVVQLVVRSWRFASEFLPVERFERIYRDRDRPKLNLSAWRKKNRFSFRLDSILFRNEPLKQSRKFFDFIRFEIVETFRRHSWTSDLIHHISH